MWRIGDCLFGDGRVACVAASHDATKSSPILRESQRSISSHVFITSHTIIGCACKYATWPMIYILNNNNCYYILIHMPTYIGAYMHQTYLYIILLHTYSYIHARPPAGPPAGPPACPPACPPARPNGPKWIADWKLSCTCSRNSKTQSYV